MILSTNTFTIALDDFCNEAIDSLIGGIAWCNTVQPTVVDLDTRQHDTSNLDEILITVRIGALDTEDLD